MTPARELAGRLLEAVKLLHEYRVTKGVLWADAVQSCEQSAALLLSQAEQLDASQKRNVELNTIVDSFQKQITSLQSAERERDAVIEAAKALASIHNPHADISWGYCYICAVKEAIDRLTAAEREEKRDTVP